MKQTLLKVMKSLNQSVYLSLKNYQETYEFYRAKQEIPEVLKLKVIQGLWNEDENTEEVAA